MLIKFYEYWKNLVLVAKSQSISFVSYFFISLALDPTKIYDDNGTIYYKHSFKIHSWQCDRTYIPWRFTATY